MHDEYFSQACEPVLEHFMLTFILHGSFFSQLFTYSSHDFYTHTPSSEYNRVSARNFSRLPLHANHIKKTTFHNCLTSLFGLGSSRASNFVYFQFLASKKLAKISQNPNLAVVALGQHVTD